MNQAAFIARGEARWRAFEALVTRLEAGKVAPSRDFPRAYRSLCHDLALARARQFDAHLVDRLNGLALRGHQRLYLVPAGTWQRVVDFWVVGFPKAVRAEAGFVLVATLLFFGTGIGLGALVVHRPDLVFSVLDPPQVAELEAMYNPASPHHLRPRGADSDAAMFGFYIRNNIGIGFRTFAGGVFAGLGSLFFLLVNGVLLGAVSGHLIHVGFATSFTSFVVGHGAFELPAIALAAAAGLRLGWPLLAPGAHTRLDGLRLSARRAIPLVYGSTGMLVVAACVEAFWSANVVVGAQVKYAVGAGLWLMVLVYFLTPRRGHGA